MRICLLRHGPAVPRGSGGVEDDARPLTPEGRARVRAAARGMRALGLGIDVLWTSPLPRALQTAEILAKDLGLGEPRLTEHLRPEASTSGFARLLREARGDCPAFVGHEPGLGELVAFLTGARPDAFPIKKAGLAVLEITRAGAKPLAELRLLLTPRVLRALGRR